MAEGVSFSINTDRRTVYGEIAPQIEVLIGGESDFIANLANVAAVLKESLRFFWVGFYLVNDGQLVLGPFQGPVACTRIDFDKGVCGHAYSTGQTVIVPDVEAFPDHIACASESRSEIVVPMFDQAKNVFGVLDVDSDKVNDFNDDDRTGLESIVRVIERATQGHTHPDSLE